MPQVRVNTPFNVLLDFEIASVLKRGAAWIIDVSILLIFAWGMRYFLYQVVSSGKYKFSPGVDLLLVSLPMLLYQPLMEIGFQGQSVGKKLLKIRVISLKSGEPHLGQYLIRWGFRFWELPLFFGQISFNALGMIWQVVISCMLAGVVFLIMMFSPRHQRFGDMAAGTAVVDLLQRFGLADTLFTELPDEGYEVKFPEVMRLTDRDMNALKEVLKRARLHNDWQVAAAVTTKIRTLLHVTEPMDDLVFIDRLIQDYNYLATRNK